MPIGYCLVRNYDQAAQFVLMLDLFFIGIALWRGEGFRDTEDQRPSSQEFASAMVGLPAGIIARFCDTSKQRVGVAMLFAAAASCLWAYTIYIDLNWMSRVHKKIDDGYVSVDWPYWPAQWGSILILVLVMVNHAFLAIFCKKRVQYAIGDIPAERDFVDGII